MWLQSVLTTYIVSNTTKYKKKLIFFLYYNCYSIFIYFVYDNNKIRYYPPTLLYSCYFFLQYLFQWHFYFCDILIAMSLRQYHHNMLACMRSTELRIVHEQSFKSLNDTWTRRFSIGYILNEGRPLKTDE